MYACFTRWIGWIWLQEIDRRAGQRGRVLPVLLQINLAREPQKGGMPVEEVLPFLRKMRDFSGLHVEGLMSIMPQYAGEDELRELFRGMRRLFDRLREENLENVEMRELSMACPGLPHRRPGGRDHGARRHGAVSGLSIAPAMIPGGF